MVSKIVKHRCESSRGIKDQSSFTTTYEYGGRFSEPTIRNEFLNLIAQ
nr:GTP cyclohydrolase I [Winogradskyella sp. SM1960]